MKNRKAITPDALTGNIFEMIGKDWMLVTASNGDTYNTMTASWGAVGVMWAKNVFYCHIRPQRYTYEIVEKSDTITLSIFGGEYKKELSYMGNFLFQSVQKIGKQLSCVLDTGTDKGAVGAPRGAEGNADVEGNVIGTELLYRIHCGNGGLQAQLPAVGRDIVPIPEELVCSCNGAAL